MLAQRISPMRLDPPDSLRLRLSFHLLWIIDMTTAALLLLLPDVVELNPVTVALYELFGLPGVVVAACCYAIIVLAVSNYLIHPVDLMFLGMIVSLYAFFVFTNVMLLAFDQPLTVVPVAGETVEIVT